MATVSAFISALGESATWRSRALGARNAVTNWPAESFTDTTIRVRVDEISTRESDLPSGRVTEKRMKLFTLSDVKAMDQITYKNEVFEVESVTTPIYLLGNVSFRRVIIVKMT